jgi:hypothetical protein
MADGGPFVICHGGMAGAFFQRLAEGHDNRHSEHLPHEQDTSEHDAWEYCPVGTTGTYAALTTNIDFQLPFLPDVLDSAYRPQLTYWQFASAYHARAPPLL